MLQLSEFHQAGFDHPERFDPDRWRDIGAGKVNHIPFGVGANRPCPARALAPIAMRAAATEILRRFALYSSATHTRSMPNHGPCLLTPRSSGTALGRPATALTLMRMRDRWEDVWRGLTQLVHGLGRAPTQTLPTALRSGERVTTPQKPVSRSNCPAGVMG
ncbi:MAG: cytochrome P450 [Pseudonocardiales bacterium]